MKTLAMTKPPLPRTFRDLPPLPRMLPLSFRDLPPTSVFAHCSTPLRGASACFRVASATLRPPVFLRPSTLVLLPRCFRTTSASFRQCVCTTFVGFTFASANAFAQLPRPSAHQHEITLASANAFAQLPRPSAHQHETNVLPRKLTRGFRDLTPTRLFTPELTPMLPPRFRHASARRGITSFASANASAQLPPPYARHVWRMPQSSRASAEFCPRPYVNVREGVFDAGHVYVTQLYVI